MTTDDLRRLRDAAHAAQQASNSAAAEFHKAVAAALDGGASASVLAAELAVTRARVYQWRDKARR